VVGNDKGKGKVREDTFAQVIQHRTHGNRMKWQEKTKKNGGLEKRWWGKEF